MNIRIILTLIIAVCILSACKTEIIECTAEYSNSSNDGSVAVSSDDTANSSSEDADESNGSIDESLDVSEELLLTILSEPAEIYFIAADENGKIYCVHHDNNVPILSKGIEVYVKCDEIKEFIGNDTSYEFAVDYELTARYVGLIARTY